MEPGRTATIRIRPGEPSDWPHVRDSFAAEYHNSPHGSPMSGAMRRRCIDALLRSSAWSLSIACPLSRESDLIYGWIVNNANAVAWFDVAPRWRGHGFGRALLRHAGRGRGNWNTPFVPANVAEWEARGYVLRHRPHLLLREIFAAQAEK